MRIGIVCEGPSDAAVITNILKGITGLDTNDFVPIVPIIDNTSKAHLNADTFSNWNVVQKECIEKKKIDSFFNQVDSRYIVVHIDTAEAELYGIDIPDIDGPDYCEQLRLRVKTKIMEWLNGRYLGVTLYAIAIQEIDAWVLTIYDNNINCKIRDPKKQFQKAVSKAGFKYSNGFNPYLAYSYDFRNSNKTKKKGYLDYNCSLRLFWEEAENTLLPAPETALPQ